MSSKGTPRRSGVVPQSHQSNSIHSSIASTSKTKPMMRSFRQNNLLNLLNTPAASPDCSRAATLTAANLRKHNELLEKSTSGAENECNSGQDSHRRRHSTGLSRKRKYKEIPVSGADLVHLICEPPNHHSETHLRHVNSLAKTPAQDDFFRNRNYQRERNSSRSMVGAEKDCTEINCASDRGGSRQRHSTGRLGRVSSAIPATGTQEAERICEPPNDCSQETIKSVDFTQKTPSQEAVDHDNEYQNESMTFITSRKRKWTGLCNSRSKSSKVGPFETSRGSESVMNSSVTESTYGHNLNNNLIRMENVLHQQKLERVRYINSQRMSKKADQTNLTQNDFNQQHRHVIGRIKNVLSEYGLTTMRLTLESDSPQLQDFVGKPLRLVLKTNFALSLGLTSDDVIKLVSPWTVIDMKTFAFIMEPFWIQRVKSKKNSSSRELVDNNEGHEAEASSKFTWVCPCRSTLSGLATVSPSKCFPVHTQFSYLS